MAPPIPATNPPRAGLSDAALPRPRRRTGRRHRSSSWPTPAVSTVVVRASRTAPAVFAVAQGMVAGIALILKYGQSQFQSYPKNAVVPIAV